ncbi:MAG TPA: TfoX/Sxy family protein [Dehalococcoidia bacterium]|nr:TfoX/Sxy family protein [Dehalococcoidia bacterium]
MGERGAKYSEDVGEFAEQIVDELSEIGEMTWRKMFGGVGVLVDEKIFALIDSDARLHLQVDDSNRARYEAVEAEKHSRMPYFTVPEDVVEDNAALTDWASQSVAIARTG